MVETSIPCDPSRLNVFVPWNEVVVLDPVKLSRTSETGVLIPDLMTPRKPCKDHDFDLMKPLVLATWKHGFQVNRSFNLNDNH